MKIDYQSAEEKLDGFTADLNKSLKDYLERKTAESTKLLQCPDVLAKAISDLTLCGGKRLRAQLAYAGALAINPECDRAHLIHIGSALELLQTYLLIHDDWMDSDRIRRGNLTVHYEFRKTMPDHTADSLAILAGDLASTYAWEKLSETKMQRQLFSTFVAIHKEVILGQSLDIRANTNVVRMHELKTTSYTVSGPLRLAASLLDANKNTERTFQDYSKPIGQAFQMRDDLLGTFPSTESGKSSDDILERKENSILHIAKASGSKQMRELFDDLSQTREANQAVRCADQIRKLLNEEGFKSEIESRIDNCYQESISSLERADLSYQGKNMLAHLARKMAYRSK